MTLVVSALIKPSRNLLFLLITIASVALVSLHSVVYLFCMRSVILHLAVSLIFCTGFMLLASSLWRPLSTFFRLEIGEDGRVVVRSLDAAFDVISSRTAFLRSPIIIWPQLIVLNLLDEFEGKEQLIIPRDAVGCDGFRRLSVVLLCISRKNQLNDDAISLSGGNF